MIKVYFIYLYQLVFVFNFCISWSESSTMEVCKTHDLNAANNCLPVNCEEKYFGKRNFFNRVRNVCEVAPQRMLPQVCTVVDKWQIEMLYISFSTRLLLRFNDVNQLRMTKCYIILLISHRFSWYGYIFYLVYV